MNQLGSGNGVGGSDVPPPPRHEQIQDVAGLAMGVEPERLQSITRDKISEYIQSKQYLASLRGLLPEVARQLEEILFKVHSCMRDYYSMMEEPFETELQLALGLWSPRKQLSGQQIPSFPIVGIEFDTPPIITEGSGNPKMYSYVTNNMGIASSSTAVPAESANMGSSLPDENLEGTQAQDDPREHMLSCPVCMNELVDASSTICGHIFCNECIKASIRSQRKCPTCRKKLGTRGFHRLYLPTTD